MLSYYTVLTFLCWMALAVLCVLVRENSWIPRQDKKSFYLTYVFIAASALAEWLGLQMNGDPNVNRNMLAAVKCADYILTPLAGGAIVWPMKPRSRWHKPMIGVLAFNAVFQLVSAFAGWMIRIDENNRYTHGPLYWIYIGVYALVIALIIACFLVYGQSHRRQNRASLYSVMVLVIAGIAIQEATGGENRTAYIALAMGAALMFIHYAEFYQLTTQDRLKTQQSQIMQDALTGVLSRFAYEKAIKAYEKSDRLPSDLAAFTIDINGLKNTNDTAGHDMGDQLIIGSARCIERAMGKNARCFRVGGDEFVVLVHMDKEQAEQALRRLEREAARWKESDVKISLSAGYALAHKHPDYTAKDLVKAADQAMYVAKAAYYKANGHDRRERR